MSCAVLSVIYLLGLIMAAPYRVRLTSKMPRNVRLQVREFLPSYVMKFRCFRNDDRTGKYRSLSSSRLYG